MYYLILVNHYPDLGWSQYVLGIAETIDTAIVMAQSALDGEDHDSIYRPDAIIYRILGSGSADDSLEQIQTVNPSDASRWRR